MRRVFIVALVLLCAVQARAEDKEKKVYVFTWDTRGRENKKDFTGISVKVTAGKGSGTAEYVLEMFSKDKDTFTDPPKVERWYAVDFVNIRDGKEADRGDFIASEPLETGAVLTNLKKLGTIHVKGTRTLNGKDKQIENTVYVFEAVIK